MRNSVFPALMMMVLMTIGLFTSCEKDSDLTTSVVDIDNYVDSTMYDMQRNANCGRFGCYELVFPITLNFPDGTSAEVDSYEDLRETLYAWKEANPEAGERPVLAFPIDLLTEDGEVVTVENREELGELRRACRRDFWRNNGPRGHRNRPMFCFKPVYPLSLTFPDGTITEVEDLQEMKDVLRTWKSENRDAEGRPKFVFPMEVEYEDGTTATVESPADIRALKEECAEGA
jgi:hypothetical protein